MHDAVVLYAAPVDALLHRSTTVYDKTRVAARIDPLGFRHTNVYDPAGRTIAQIDPLQ